MHYKHTQAPKQSLKPSLLVVVLLIILGMVVGAYIALRAVESQIEAVPQTKIDWLGN